MCTDIPTAEFAWTAAVLSWPWCRKITPLGGSSTPFGHQHQQLQMDMMNEAKLMHGTVPLSKRCETSPGMCLSGGGGG